MMTNNWQQSYFELANFITGHKEIEITDNRVCISNNARLQFYKLFDSVRLAFLEENHSDLINVAIILSREYIKVEKEIIKLLKLSNISMQADLYEFLHSPTTALTKIIFEPLFDLLKNRLNVEAFTTVATRNIATCFSAFYQLGYEKWVELSLVKLLEADTLFQVPQREINNHEARLIDQTKEQIDIPQQSNHLDFKHKTLIRFVVPELMVRSTKINNYISISPKINNALVIGVNASKNREWIPLDSTGILESDLIFINIASNPEDVAIVADNKKICRPDMLIVVKGQENWFQKELLERIKVQHNNLKPYLGTYIVSKELVSEEECKNLQGEIYIKSVGFNQTNFETIINAIKSNKNKELLRTQA